MSEHTFYHPEVGTWVAIDDVPHEIMGGYPEGTVEIEPAPGAGYRFNGSEWVKVPATIDEMRATKTSAIVAKADLLISSGALASSGLHIAMDDGSRADLTAMAATAMAASTGAASWPVSYSRGWITIENVRIPLPMPADGLRLAASVGDYYAAIVQHRRDLKDACIAAEDAAALDAIDISAGWPG